jgi:hypothetical protein
MPWLRPEFRDAQLPAGRFLYERLDSGPFQRLIAALLTHKYDQDTSYPIGQKDGGRDTEPNASGDLTETPPAKCIGCPHAEVL